MDNTDIGAWVKANFTYTTEDAIVGLNNIVEVGRTFSHFDAEPVKPDPQAILSRTAPTQPTSSSNTSPSFNIQVKAKRARENIDANKCGSNKL